MGSDGNGLYQYYNSKYLYQSVTFDDKKFNLSKPIRAIFLDDKNTLWLGTKGNGILRIFDYDINKNEFDYKTENIFTTNNRLTDNSIFAFAKSKQDILWIGGEDGLTYYSYPENRIKNVKSEMPIRYVHSIQEQGDSLLWIATVGDGILKACIGGRKNNPELINMKRYTINNNLFASNYFFTHYIEDEHTAWFGNRGNGAFTINDGTKLVPHPLIKPYDSNAINDVFSIIKDGNTLWLGTSDGLIRQTPENETLFNDKDGFPNNSIHSMLFDERKNLWLATNKGIIRFDTTRDNFQIYDKQNGLNVTEFCDGAAFSSPNGLFFGGVNGFISIMENLSDSMQKFSPSLIFEKLEIYDSKQDRFIYLGQNQHVTLNYNENYFSISFVAIDYINCNNYVYQYKIGDKNDKWIDNGALNKISFTKMPHGKYEMYVKYKNRYTNEESGIYSVNIEILPPWYLSKVANIIYFLFILILIAVFFKLMQLRNKKKRGIMLERLEHRHNEELYEEKLRFLTNITHEFSTPLTLISGPCQRISAYEYSDSYINKYVEIIKINAERLNALVQEIIDYRRIATGNQTCNIQTHNVSQQLLDIIATFSELIERNNISFETEIKDTIYWNTDDKCFNKIAANLISNALKYTPPAGTIKACLYQSDKNLIFRVYNTGKGIKESDKDSIFNRYTILGNSKESSVKGLPARNGLGMAICKSMVELLNGDIIVESEIDKFAEFIVTLPEMTSPDEGHSECDVTEATITIESESENDINLSKREDVNILENENPDKNKFQYNILAVDDNKDILFLINDILKTEYNVLLAANGEEGLEILKKGAIHLIITDIMMPEVDGIELIKIIKSNKHTMHIPLIILSAKNSTDSKIEGIVSGADVYIAKPFDTNYLKSIVKRLIINREELKEYYNSSASAFEFTNGQLLEKEDKDFLDLMIQVMEQNLDNVDFTYEELTKKMKMSIRAFYRKFESLTQSRPQDFIKNYRLNYAAKLLVTTNYTVQEIMYETGFNNRSHFYREFNKKFNNTPQEYRSLYKKKDISS
jgi:signal transduction histidine kinase/DNA-binding response OmpR family regulator